MNALARALFCVVLVAMLAVTPSFTETASAANPHACERWVTHDSCEFIYQPGLLTARLHQPRLPVAVRVNPQAELCVIFFCVPHSPCEGRDCGGFPTVSLNQTGETTWGPRANLEIRRALTGQVILSCKGDLGCAVAKNVTWMTPGETLVCDAYPGSGATLFTGVGRFRCASGSG